MVKMIHIAENAVGNDREKSYAGVFARAAAYVADCLILFAGLIVWQAALYSVNPIVGIINGGRQPTGGELHLWVFATATVPFLFYFARLQSSARGATFGMRLLKIKITDLNGNRIGFWRALLRSAVMLVPFEANHAVMFHLAPTDGSAPPLAFWLGVAAVWVLIAVYVSAILLTPRRQSLHDLLAATVVRRASSPSEAN